MSSFFGVLGQEMTFICFFLQIQLFTKLHPLHWMAGDFNLQRRQRWQRCSCEESRSKISFGWLGIKLWLIAQIFGSGDFSADAYYRESCRSQVLNATVQSPCNFQVIFLPMIWSTLETKVITGYSRDNWSTWEHYSDHLSPFQGSSFQLVDLLRQVVSSPAEIKLDYFSQTVCRHIRVICSTYSFSSDKLILLQQVKCFMQQNLFIVAMCRPGRLEKWFTDTLKVFVNQYFK